MRVQPAIRALLRGLRPVGLVMVGTGVLIGFMLGRVLRPLPSISKTAYSAAPVKPLSKRMHEPRPKVVTVAGNQEVETFMRRVSEARTLDAIIEQLPQRDYSKCREWTCVASPEELIALARAGELGLVEKIFEWSPTLRRAAQNRLRGYILDGHKELAIISWAQSEPDGAWRFFCEHTNHNAESFIGWMTRNHWPLVRDLVSTKPSLVFDHYGIHDGRMRDAASDVNTLRQLIMDYPEGPARALAGTAAAKLHKFYDAPAADRLAAEFIPPETK